MSNNTVFLYVFAASALAPGCSDPGLKETFGGATWESAHYRYHYREDDALACPEVLDSLEAYGTVLTDVLGVSASEWTRTSYFKYPSQAELHDDQACRSTAEACTDGKQIVAVAPLHGHELVHNVMAKQTSTSVSVLLAEGLANALSCAPGTLPKNPHWDFRTFASPPSEADVVQAGRLVLGLMQHVTPLDVMDMLAGGGRGESLAATRARILADYGLDLDVIQAEVEESGLGSCVPVYACSGAPLSEGTRQLAVDCAGPERVTLPNDLGPVSVRVTGAPARFMPCDLAHATSPIARVSPFRPLGNWQYWVDPPISPHALWLDGADDAEEARLAEVTLATLPTAFAASCDDSAGSTLALDTQVAIVVDGVKELLHFPLGFAVASRLAIDWQKGQDAETFRVPTEPVEVSWCQSCSAGTAVDCQVLDRLMVEAQVVEVGAAGVLRIRPSAPLSKAAVLQVTVRSAP